MNGELLQLLQLTISAKYYLKCDEVFEPRLDYIKSLHFHFLPQVRLFAKRKTTAASVSDWLRELKKRDVQEVRFYGNTVNDDRNMTGFSNAVRDWMIYTRYPQAASGWMKAWQFDQQEKKWKVSYTEVQAGRYDAAPFPDITDRFGETLRAITTLAEELEQPHFAKMFAGARDVLAGTNAPETRYTMLPEGNMRLLEAAQMAWVFGAMGSWNDSPPYIAQEKKLNIEYEKLSADLYRDLMAAAIYAVNEW